MFETNIVLTVSEFRSDFPEFSADKYSDDLISAFIEQTGCYISNSNIGLLHGKCRRLGMELMLGHLLTLYNSIQTNQIFGQVASASIDSVHVSMLTPPNKNQFEYWLNQTPYGQRLFLLLSSKAPAGLYLGGSFKKVLQ